MSSADLIRMANQIATNFARYPEEEALEGIASHICQFWEPRMVAELRAVRPEDLSPTIRRALLRV
jgi:formate dehydrogenase subunit delta